MAKSLKIGLLVLVLLLAAAAACLLAGAAWLRGESGRAWLIAQIEGATDPAEGTGVTIGVLEGDPLGAMVFHDLVVADAEGPWLTAASMEVAWNPWSIATGRLEVQRLKGEDVSVIRQPRTPESAGTDGTAGTMDPTASPLPLDLSVAELSIQPLTLGEAFLGEPAVFAVAGSLGSRAADELRTRLTVERTDQAQGTLQADVTYRLSDERLQASLALDEPTGGLARLLSGLESAGATKVALEGEGLLKDLKGTLTASVAGLGAIEADYELAVAEPLDLSLKGSADIAWRPPEVPPALIEGPLAFELAVRLHGGKDLEVATLVLDNAAARVAASGRLGLDGKAIDAQAEVTAKDESVLEQLTAPLSLQGPAVTIRATGSLERPQLALDASLAGLAGADFNAGATRLTLDLGAAEAGPWPFVLRAEIAGLTQQAEPGLQPLLDGPLTLEAEGGLELQQDRVSLARASLDNRQLALSASGNFGFAGSLDLEADYSLKQLAALEGLAGLALAGSAQGKATVRSADPAQGLEGSVTARFDPLEIPDEALTALLGATPSLATGFTLGADDRLRLEGLAVETASGSITGDLALDLGSQSIAGELRGEFPALSKLEVLAGTAMAGKAEVRATLSGPLGDPAAEGRLSLRGARIAAAEEAFDLDADYRAQNLVSAPQGRVTVSLRAEPLQARAATRFALSETSLSLAELSLDSDGVQLAGTLTVPLSGAPLLGELTAELSDPEPLLSLVDIEASAQGSLRAALSANGTKQALEASGELARLRYGPASAPVATADSARLSARLDDLAALAVSTLDAELTDLRAGGATMDRLQATASGDTSGARFTLATAGDFQGDFSLEAVGAVALSEELSELTLNRLKGKVLGEAIRLEKPGSFAFGQRLLEARGIALAFGPARLSIDGRLADGRVEAALSGRDVPLAFARLAVPESEIDGTLRFEASLSGPAARPTGRYEAEATDIILGRDLGAPPLNVQLEGSLEDGRLTSRASLSGFAAQNAEAELVAPLRLSADPIGFELPDDEPISGHARWSGELARVWPLVPLVGHAASGATEVDARLEGTFADPLIRGSASIDAGSYENFETGTLVRKLRLEARFDGETLRLVRLEGNDGGSGKLDASGSLTMDPGGDFPVEAEVNLTTFTAMRRDDVTAAASGALRFSGDMAASLLEGTLTTDGVEIRIPDTLPPQIVDLKVIETGPEGEIKEGREAAGGSGDSDIRLDLTVDMPNRVFVRGRGLDTEWGGRLTVTGTAARPVIQGELSNQRGSLTVIGKRFDLRESRISFAGTDELIPILDIRATHEAGDVTVVAMITGTPDAPELNLSSEPVLPRDEILSRVLFGKTTAQLSPVQAIQLASAASELSGGIGATGVLDRTRGLLGVDVLDVEATENADSGETGAALSAGKYVTDNVFVGVKQGTTPGSSSVGVEVELTDEISIESDVGSSGESKLGVKFEWDY